MLPNDATASCRKCTFPYLENRHKLRSRRRMGMEVSRRLWRPGELQFVADRDSVAPHARNLRLDPAALLHRLGMDRRQDQPAALIEPHRIEVVVGRDQPEAA